MSITEMNWCNTSSCVNAGEDQTVVLDSQLSNQLISQLLAYLLIDERIARAKVDI